MVKLAQFVNLIKQKILIFCTCTTYKVKIKSMKILEKIFLSKYFVLVLFLMLFLSLAINLANQSKVSIPTKSLPIKQIELVINKPIKNFSKVKMSVEVAKKDFELSKGLSGRKSLAENSGMLFEIGERRFVTFWMKDMLFPIDIIWIDRELIVGITKNCPIPKDKNNFLTFKSPQPVTSVLEVNAGFTNIKNISIGDKFIKDN